MEEAVLESPLLEAVAVLEFASPKSSVEMVAETAVAEAALVSMELGFAMLVSSLEEDLHQNTHRAMELPEV